MKIGKLGMGLIGLALVAMTGCQSAAKPQGDSWSAIEDRGKLVVGIDDTFAPMGFRDENNELAGYDIEMAKAVSEKLPFMAAVSMSSSRFMVRAVRQRS